MTRRTITPILIASTLALAGCVTAPGPVEVTRFVEPSATERLGSGTIFVTAAPGEPGDSLEMSAYTAAVAGELRGLGYTEAARTGADQVAEVRFQRYTLQADGSRSPVSVGVGGSTGSYGSGVGLGIGINLGGGAKDKVGTEMAVTIRDRATGQNLWEGRANFAVAENSPLADRRTSAQTVAAALFSDFPGNNGETVEIEVP